MVLDPRIYKLAGELYGLLHTGLPVHESGRLSMIFDGDRSVIYSWDLLVDDRLYEVSYIFSLVELSQTRSLEGLAEWLVYKWKEDMTVATNGRV